MKIAILSDIHSNLEALESVLKEIDQVKPDRIFFLGDAVGYGPDPNACVEKIFDTSDKVIAGNHDHGVLGLTDIECFNPFARQAILWNRSILTRENTERLSSMPLTAQEDDLFLVHATPEKPEEWGYIYSPQDTELQYEYFQSSACFIGHTHSPSLYFSDGDEFGETRETVLTFREGFRYIVNVGSVGQPRDRNPDAGYVLFDTETKKLSFNRVRYNFRITQEKMRAVNLPEYLINRLESGT